MLPIAAPHPNLATDALEDVPPTQASQQPKKHVSDTALGDEIV